MPEIAVTEAIRSTRHPMSGQVPLLVPCLALVMFCTEDLSWDVYMS